MQLLGSGTKIRETFCSGPLERRPRVLQGTVQRDSGRGRPAAWTSHQSSFHRTEDERLRGILAPRRHPLSWDEIVEQSGVARAQIREIAEVVMRSKSMIACWAMGLTQQRQAVATIQEIVNLLLLGGHIGRPGAGVCPVRGHSNVQGDRTMGIWERMPASFSTSFATISDSSRRASMAGMWSSRSRRCIEATRLVSSPWAATFSRPHPIPNSPPRLVTLPPDGARFDQAESRASHHGKTGADPALPRPHRSRPAGSGRAVCRASNSMGIVHTSRGSLEPPFGRTAQRTGDRGATGRGHTR